MLAVPGPVPASISLRHRDKQLSQRTSTTLEGIHKHSQDRAACTVSSAFSPSVRRWSA